MKKIAPFKVLVLDDLKSTTEMVKLILEGKLGCNVRTCNSVAEVNVALEDFDPDLFLLDIEIKEGRVFDFVKEWIKDEGKNEVPIIYFSAHATPKTRVEALNSGGNDYLDKPFYPDELISRVRIHIQSYKQKEMIEEELEEQRALLGVLCHDVQNPLASVFTLCDHLIEYPDSDVMETLGLIQNSAKSGLDLLNHVREYKRLTNEEIEFSKEAVDIIDAIDESIQIVKPIANRKQIQFVFNHDLEMSAVINRVIFVHNIICNILSNAIKFSYAESEIHITVRKVVVSGDPYCQIDIKDRGFGIPDNLLQNLFNPAKNRSRNGTENEIGSGLGMPLVKYYLEKFSGSITVRSVAKEDNPDKSGTCMTVQIPVK